MSYQEDSVRPHEVLALIGVGVVALVTLAAVILGIWAGTASFSRYQKRQHAQNEVRVNEIRIHTYEQKVKIAEQEANIRVKRAIGIRKSQDEISETLTPLYVQFEMVHSLQEIAKSGRNNSVVFLPTGAGGVPLVTDLAEVMNGAMMQRGEE